VGAEAALRPGALSGSPEIRSYYEQGREASRLLTGHGLLEFTRTQEILRRHLPHPPASVLDVGGASGVHAAWLAQDGYRVHVVDSMELHVEQALAAARAHPQATFTAAIGDARALTEEDASTDAVLLLGPLYHLTTLEDRLAALREAARVTRPRGPVFVAAISRFASLVDGLLRRFVVEPEFREIVEQDLRDGQHRNPTGRPDWFTTAYFHHPDELRDEVLTAGLELVELVGIEGPGWLVPNMAERWRDETWREAVLFAARAVEAEPSMLGAAGHLMAVARKPA
jgi:ubiquinone/menaquinone biosynthesis C-methylase UbiE